MERLVPKYVNWIKSEEILGLQVETWFLSLLYVQEVVTQPKILNRTILSKWIQVTKIILLCKRIIFNLKYCNS